MRIVLSHAGITFMRSGNRNPVRSVRKHSNVFPSLRVPASGFSKKIASAYVAAPPAPLEKVQKGSAYAPEQADVTQFDPQVDIIKFGHQSKRLRWVAEG